jgi:UDP-N-acetyl-D-mannosaminuronate dehydrogenase
VRITVVALGKIGLPLAVQFASKGHEVLGVDVNPTVVDLVNKGEELFPGEARLAEKLAELVPAGRLRATTDYADAVPGSDTVVLVVSLFASDGTWESDDLTPTMLVMDCKPVNDAAGLDPLRR